MLQCSRTPFSPKRRGGMDLGRLKYIVKKKLFLVYLFISLFSLFHIPRPRLSSICRWSNIATYGIALTKYCVYIPHKTISKWNF
jgi:hypothetical protein